MEIYSCESVSLRAQCVFLPFPFLSSLLQQGKKKLEFLPTSLTPSRPYAPRTRSPRCVCVRRINLSPPSLPPSFPSPISSPAEDKMGSSRRRWSTYLNMIFLFERNSILARGRGTFIYIYMYSKNRDMWRYCRSCKFFNATARKI